MIENLSGSELVRLYNVATSEAVTRFSDRRKGAARLSAALEERGLMISASNGVPFVVLDPSKLDAKDLALIAPADPVGDRLAAEARVASASADLADAVDAEDQAEETAGHDAGATDAKVLELLRENGPCKIGKIRNAWKSEDAAIAALRDKQLKGRMRASVRRLEAAGKVTKDGAIFAAVRASTGRPGDAAATYAEETGVDYATALVACNMD